MNVPGRRRTGAKYLCTFLNKGHHFYSDSCEKLPGYPHTHTPHPRISHHTEEKVKARSERDIICHLSIVLHLIPRIVFFPNLFEREGRESTEVEREAESRLNGAPLRPHPRNPRS